MPCIQSLVLSGLLLGEDCITIDHEQKVAVYFDIVHHRIIYHRCVNGILEYLSNQFKPKVYRPTQSKDIVVGRFPPGLLNPRRSNNGPCGQIRRSVVLSSNEREVDIGKQSQHSYSFDRIEFGSIVSNYGELDMGQ
jgi:hypothetical protein